MRVCRGRVGDFSLVHLQRYISAVHTYTQGWWCHLLKLKRAPDDLDGGPGEVERGEPGGVLGRIEGRLQRKDVEPPAKALVCVAVCV